MPAKNPDSEMAAEACGHLADHLAVRIEKSLALRHVMDALESGTRAIYEVAKVEALVAALRENQTESHLCHMNGSADCHCCQREVAALAAWGAQ